MATTANSCHQQFERLAADALDYALKAGQALLDAKLMIPHGGFETWVTTNVSFSSRTARSYMRVASNWPAIAAKKNENPALSLRDAIELLTTSKTEESQNGSALPFCLPAPGEVLVGIVGDIDCIVVEACPNNPRHVRIASLIGVEILFDRRGVNRDAAGWAIGRLHGIELSTIFWSPPAIVSVANNPLANFIPEWSYEVDDRADATDENAISAVADNEFSRLSKTYTDGLTEIRKSGRSLLNIRDKQLYRCDGYQTFNEYLDARYGYQTFNEYLDARWSGLCDQVEPAMELAEESPEFRG